MWHMRAGGALRLHAAGQEGLRRVEPGAEAAVPAQLAQPRPPRRVRRAAPPLLPARVLSGGAPAEVIVFYEEIAC